MTQRGRVWLQVVMWVCLIGGIHMFLNSAHSTGEALERIRITLSPASVGLVGVTLAVVSAAVLIALSVCRRKGDLKHR